jgi:2-polyprenyl-3-methyl-5-hydroxy-6-metoxy-1,4-benzoquinol methylase
MGEWRLFPEGTVPEFTTEVWYTDRERAPHLEQDAHRERLYEAAAQVHAAAQAYDLRTVSDLGAGDGGLLSLLDPTRIHAAWGYDLQQTNVDAAWKDRGVNVEYGNVVEGWTWFNHHRVPIRFGDIAVATETLEHLVDPHIFVRTVAKNSRVLVASSPCNERPGSAYEFHCWAWDQDGYRTLLEQAGFHVVAQQIHGGFQVLTGVRP